MPCCITSLPVHRLRGVRLALFLFLAGCGGYGSSGSGPDQGLVIVADLYVDAATGSDAGTGSVNDPLRTITRALVGAQPGQRIHVRPGRYEAPFERLPLIVPEGVELIGDEPNRGLGADATELRGVGQVPAHLQGVVINGGPVYATLIPLPGSVVAGFVIRAQANGDPRSLVRVRGPYASPFTLRRCRLAADDGWVLGVSIAEGAAAIVRDNILEDLYIGIAMSDMPSITVEGNLLRSNHVGVKAIGAGGALGSPSGSQGGNILTGNDIDLDARSGTSVIARNNYWDHVPPQWWTEGYFPFFLGADIARKANVQVDTAGAASAPPAASLPPKTNDQVSW